MPPTTAAANQARTIQTDQARRSQNSLANLLDSSLRELQSTNRALAKSQVVSTLADELTRVRAKTGEEAWFQAIGPQCRSHKIAEILSEDPYTARALEKPRGFAGDAAMLDYIYSGIAPRGTSKIGQAIFSATTGSPSGRSVVDRRNRLASAIRHASSIKPGARILAIACGHLREAQLLSCEEMSAIAQLVAFDQDQLALDLVRLEQGCGPISVVNGNIRDMIARRIEFSEMDLVYAAGIFDYLSNEVSVRLLKKMFESLSPGGRLVVGNFMPANSGRAYMETFMDWRLIYRTPGDLRALGRRAFGSREIKIERVGTDELSNIAYLDVTVA